LGADLVAQRHVRVNILHVIGVFEDVDKLVDLEGSFKVELYLGGSDELDFGGIVIDAGLLQGGAHSDDVLRVGLDDEKLAGILDFLARWLYGHIKVMDCRIPKEEDVAAK